MARNVLVSSLITQIRQRADVESTQFVTDAELISYINNSYCELYDAIVAKYADYFLSQNSFTLVPGTEFYDVPSDFYKLVGLDQQVSTGQYLTMMPVNFNERNRRFNAAYNSSLYPTYRYHLQDDKMRLSPLPTGSDTLRLWYIPAPTQITLSTQTINGRSGWEEFIINDCAAKVKIKQELDPSMYYAEKKAQLERVLKMAQNYDAGIAKRVTDIYTINDDVLFPLLQL